MLPAGKGDISIWFKGDISKLRPQAADEWGQNIKYGLGRQSVLTTLEALSEICKKADGYQMPLTESSVLFLRDRIFELMKFMEQT
jgi:hypothetical protein